MGRHLWGVSCGVTHGAAVGLQLLWGDTRGRCGLSVTSAVANGGMRSYAVRGQQGGVMGWRGTIMGWRAGHDGMARDGR